ncbi:MAG TPA: hypothetical protein VG759_07090, partial [Candidatus Angelobacter sp.]|nr:hypothetical protein [Candidatus Angelobacter sp.]
QMLDKWDKAYFRSKFIVMSRDDNTFGGTFITILFQDRPDRVFVIWIYPEGKNKRLTLRRLEAGRLQRRRHSQNQYSVQEAYRGQSSCDVS